VLLVSRCVGCDACAVDAECILGFRIDAFADLIVRSAIALCELLTCHAWLVIVGTSGRGARSLRCTSLLFFSC
jgi:hypothetical protein